jgi:hypothetical protein
MSPQERAATLVPLTDEQARRVAALLSIHATPTPTPTSTTTPRRHPVGASRAAVTAVPTTARTARTTSGRPSATLRGEQP